MNTICCNTKTLAKAGGLSAAFVSAGGSDICKVQFVIMLSYNTTFVCRL